jgi:hypothetical protein
MGNFFDKWPLTEYKIDSNGLAKQTPINIFLRFGFLNGIKNNQSVYTEYLVKDGQTPEIIAEKYYGDPEAHWVVLWANDIIDPFYDWPLPYNAFIKFIENKYDSVANAQVTIHHYEKVISRRDAASDITTNTTIIINQTNTANPLFGTALPDIPWDTYDSLSEFSFEAITLANGITCEVTITTTAISNYDFEDQENEAKRSIKLIHKDHYPQIRDEFNKLMQQANPGLTFGLRSARI